MQVSTPLACGSKTQTECKVSNDLFEYNLSPLTLHDTNYKVRDTTKNLNYILNVCHVVVETANSRCPMNAGSCLLNLTEPNYNKRFESNFRY